MTTNAISSIAALEWEDRYYGLAIRVATAAAFLFTILAFLVLPKEFVVRLQVEEVD